MMHPLQRVLLPMLVPVLLPAQARPARLSRADEPQLARVLAMSDTRRLDTMLVDSALGARSPHLRAAAVRAIGQVGGRVRSARLQVLLEDPDSAVAAEAAFALGKLRDSGSVMALARVLGREAVGIEAAWALGEIGAPARDALSDALRSDTLPPRVSAMSIIAASRLRPAPAALIVRHVAGAHPEVSRAAAYAIARAGLASGVRAVLPRATSPDAETRMYVATALSRRGTGDSLAADALPVLRRLVRDHDARVRVNAVRALASHGRIAGSDVVSRLRDPDANVRIATAQTLAAIADSTPAWWQPAWIADTGFTYRRSLLEGAARVAVELPAMREWLRHADWRYRAAAVGAAQLLPQRMAARDTIAIAMRSDRHGAVRAGAYALLLADSLRTGRDSVVRQALDDPAPEVRMAGLSAARVGRASTELAWLALRAYRAAARDAENDARVQALSVLRAVWLRDSLALPPPLLDSLRALAPPADARERAAAVGVAPLASWGPPAVPPAPAAWYDSIVRAVVRPSLEGRPLRAELRTERGTLLVELLGHDAPLTVANFVRLARSRYYDGARFHRIVPNFVVQDGDPGGTGSGGPGYAIRDELNRRRYQRGTMGMALSGPDTGGSQYFLCHSPQPHLDGHYTVFGQLRGGEAVLDRLVQGDRLASVRIR